MIGGPKEIEEESFRTGTFSPMINPGETIGAGAEFSGNRSRFCGAALSAAGGKTA
jgi:hypothetical protein